MNNKEKINTLLVSCMLLTQLIPLCAASDSNSTSDSSTAPPETIERNSHYTYTSVKIDEIFKETKEKFGQIIIPNGSHWLFTNITELITSIDAETQSVDAELIGSSDKIGINPDPTLSESALDNEQSISEEINKFQENLQSLNEKITIIASNGQKIKELLMMLYCSNESFKTSHYSSIDGTEYQDIIPPNPANFTPKNLIYLLSETLIKEKNNNEEQTITILPSTTASKRKSSTILTSSTFSHYPDVTNEFNQEIFPNELRNYRDFPTENDIIQIQKNVPSKLCELVKNHITNLLLISIAIYWLASNRTYITALTDKYKTWKKLEIPDNRFYLYHQHQSVDWVEDGGCCCCFFTNPGNTKSTSSQSCELETNVSNIKPDIKKNSVPSTDAGNTKHIEEQPKLEINQSDSSDLFLNQSENENSTVREVNIEDGGCCGFCDDELSTSFSETDSDAELNYNGCLLL